MRPPRLPGAESKHFLADLPGDTLRPKIPVGLQYQKSHDLMIPMGLPYQRTSVSTLWKEPPTESTRSLGNFHFQ